MTIEEHRLNPGWEHPDAGRSRRGPLDRPKRVLIFELNHTGHHLLYVSLLAEAFRGEGFEVVLASSAVAFQSKEYAVLMQNCEPYIQKLSIPQRFTGGRLRDLEHTYRLLRLVAGGEADAYFVPFLGTVYTKFGVLGTLLLRLGIKLPPVWGILLVWPFAYESARQFPQRSWREKLWHFILEQGPFQKVFLVDEIAYEYAEKQYGSPRLFFSPDPVTKSPVGDGRACRKALGLPATAKIVGALGGMTRSKGIHYLLEAFLRRGERREQYLVLLGPQDEEIRKDVMRLLQEHPANKHVIIVDRFLSESEFEGAFASVDVVAATHPDFRASSSMLLRAAAAGKPVLGADDGWIGRTMLKYRLGLSCNVRDVSSLMAGLDRALEGPGLDCSDAPLLAKRYSSERFSQTIAGCLRSLNSKEPRDSLR